MRLKPEEKEFFDTYTSKLFAEHCEIYEMKKYIQHGDTTTFEHVMAVALMCFWLSCRLPFKFKVGSLLLGAILHDFYLYDWHEDDPSHRLHGFYHPRKALINAEKYFELNDIERDIIDKHMFPLTITKVPRYRESLLVSIADKIVAVQETFKRDEHLS